MRLLSRPLSTPVVGMLLCQLPGAASIAAMPARHEIVRSQAKQPAAEAATQRFEQNNVYATYLRLLEGYRAHDEAQARELGAFWERLYGDPLVLDLLFSTIPIDLAPLTEMALTDLALAAFQRELQGLGEAHLRMAERFVDVHLRPPVLRSPAFDRHTRFAHDWYLAVIWLRFARLEFNDLGVFLNRARTKFPDDPEVLLSSGTEEEITMLRLRTARQDDRRPSQASLERTHAMQRTARAIDYFRRAIAVDPKSAEARIRLARVIATFTNGNREEALTLLRDARDIATTPPLSYLAALFAGEIEEQGKNLTEASRWYRTAIAECPRAQTARLAQSHVQLDLKDGTRGAINTLRPLPSVRLKEDNVCEPDPWRLYAFGQAWRLPTHIDMMRKQAREMTPAGVSEP